MQKMALVLGVIASALVLASCASKGTSVDQTAAAQPVAHHDYKGEVK